MNKDFLRTLHHSCKNKCRFKKTIENASLGQLNKIRNLCYRVYHRKVPIEHKTKKKLFKYKQIIRDLANTKKLKRTRDLKRKLIQHGGAFLPFILPAALGLLSSVGSQLIDRIIPT